MKRNSGQIDTVLATNPEKSSIFFFAWVTCSGPIWYMRLKTENCCLKTFVEIHVGEKVCRNTCNVV